MGENYKSYFEPDQPKKAKKVLEHKIGIWTLRLTVIGLILNGWYMQQQHDVSIKGFRLADSSLKETRRSNDVSEDNLRLSTQAFERTLEESRDDSVRFEKNFHLQKRSVDEQINSLDETQKQFQVGNQPYLQLKNYQVWIDSIDQLNAGFEVENLGNYPIKLMDVKSFFHIKIVPPDFKQVYKAGITPSMPFQRYLANKSSVNIPPTITDRMNQGHYLGLRMTNYYIYHTGLVRYKNLIGGREKEYRFQIKTYPGDKNPEFIINENQN